MERAATLLLLAWALAFVTGCGDGYSTETFDVAAMREVIEEKNRRFTEAHVTGEVGVINAYFTQDARIFLPGADVVTGSAAIAALNQEFIDYGISDFTEVTTALYGTEELLVEEGTYSMTYGEDHVREIGKYINIWKPENGEWRVRANIWNSSMPTSP